MKILFFVSSLNAGGAERVAVTLANAWARRGDNVTLVSTWLTKHEPFYELDSRIRFRQLADDRSARPLHALPGAGKWLQIRRLVRVEAPDVVVSFLTNVNVNVLLATSGLDVPVIVSERTHPAYSQSAGRVLRFLRRQTYGRAHTVVMQTMAGVSALKAQAPAVRNVAVIPNPLPDELLAALPDVRLERPTSGALRVVAMGRLVPTKQFDVLIDEFAALAQDFPDWSLVIWGEGPQRDALTDQIRKLGMSGRITLAGRTSKPWQVLAAGDLFVMTSRVEGFPNVLLEAMALGLPCIALDCPSGPAELSRGGRDARLVPMDDYVALRASMQQLMADAGARQKLGDQAQRSVRQRYALPVILEQWDGLFRQAVESRV